MGVELSVKENDMYEVNEKDIKDLLTNIYKEQKREKN